MPLRKEQVMINTILDVNGITIGQAHDDEVRTGVTVVLPDKPANCSVDVRGGGPGTREIDALNDGGLIDKVHAICLSGGSVYGLAAADGVCAWLGEKRLGYEVAPSPIPVSPIVPSAILFDNANGGDKNWGINPPFRNLGVLACESASKQMDLGKVGAGYGAMSGIYDGGVGSASEVCNEFTVGAIIAANSVGSPYMPKTKCPWAWPYEIDNEFGGMRPPENYKYTTPDDTKLSFLNTPGQSTVIGVVAIEANLTQKQLKRIAIMAQDGIAMAVQPSHTPLDGDTIFAISTGHKPCDNPAILSELGSAAARCVARSLMRAVYEASK